MENEIKRIEKRIQIINKDYFKEEKRICVEFTYEHKYGYISEPVVDGRDFILTKQIKELIKKYYNEKLIELKRQQNLRLEKYEI